MPSPKQPFQIHFLSSKGIDRTCSARSPPLSSPPVLAGVPHSPSWKGAGSRWFCLLSWGCLHHSFRGCWPTHTPVFRSAKFPCKVALFCPKTLTFNGGNNRHLKVLCPLQVPGTVDIPCEVQHTGNIKTININDFWH